MQMLSADSEASNQLQAFQRRIGADTAATSDVSPADALARRYLPALDPVVRQRIAARVRDEQRAGITAPGNSAFVLRRLELYEVALERSRAVSAAPGSLR